MCRRAAHGGSLCCAALWGQLLRYASTGAVAPPPAGMSQSQPVVCAWTSAGLQQCCCECSRVRSSRWRPCAVPVPRRHRRLSRWPGVPVAAGGDVLCGVCVSANRCSVAHTAATVAMRRRRMRWRDRGLWRQRLYVSVHCTPLVCVCVCAPPVVSFGVVPRCLLLQRCWRLCSLLGQFERANTDDSGDNVRLQGGMSMSNRSI